MVEAVFFGIAAAVVVAVWAMHPSIGDEADKGKDAPLDQQGTHKGGCM